MKMPRSLSIVFCTILCVATSSIAQITVSSVTARAGVIRTQWPDNSIYSKHLWSFYPELQVGGAFIVPYFSWGVSWGYWTDGIDQALPVMDFVTYSQSSHIVSARIAFEPSVIDDHLPVPITLFIGGAEHFTKLSYIGGTGLAGNVGQNSTDRTFTGLVGFAISYPVIVPFGVQLEALQYVPFGNNWLDKSQKNRRAFKFGVAVTL